MALLPLLVSAIFHTRGLTATADRNLKDLIRDGTFRYDPHYRLSVFPLQIPPLHERRSAIPMVATY